jgi:hypothetical protein
LLARAAQNGVSVFVPELLEHLRIR